MAEKFISTTEAAKLLGISRVAVFKQIKEGRLKAKRVGRNFMLDRNDLEGMVLSETDKKEIEKAVEKTIREYKETLKLLGQE